MLDYLVLDYNGTIAKDGMLKQAVKEKLIKLSEQMEIIIVTADTYKTVKAQLQGLPVSLVVLNSKNHTKEKLKVIKRLGKGMVAAVGNGANDRLMLKKSGLSICIIGEEGCYGRTLKSADIIVSDIQDALDILLSPDRVKATLRK